MAMIGSCGDDDAETADALAGRLELVAGDTAYPFAQAAAEQFQIEQPDVTIAVEPTGPADAFDRFCAGRADLAASPRPITPREERRCSDAAVGHDAREVRSDGAGDAVHLYTRTGERARPALRALDAFIAAHHEGIADAARRGRRALSG